MAKKRDEIKLSPPEVAEFLAAERVMNVASNGRDGWPHLTALWFVMRGPDPWSWTYRKSQKVKNLERDDHVTCLIESGHEYAELKGVMLRTRAHIEYDKERILDFAEELFAKYQGARTGDQMREALRAQAAKRVAIRFEVVETVSWDHGKLGGAY
jgi:general stress protein 26